MKKRRLPQGWNEARVKRVVDHYEQQSENEAIAEDKAAFESKTHIMVRVPVQLVPEVQDLIAKRRTK